MECTIKVTNNMKDFNLPYEIAKDIVRSSNLGTNIEFTDFGFQLIELTHNDAEWLYIELNAYNENRTYNVVMEYN